jgi:AraC-like DNA-binding protein
MNPRLIHIKNWPELAREASWSTSALAKRCGVSERTLRRHFFRQMGKCPREWLLDQRLHSALELLLAGSSVKLTAYRLGYKHPSNFGRQYKSRTGVHPSRQQA